MIVGTAGHIDHGKTSLVKALTGVDTDRLKEEKARGITIELGFAYWPRPHLGQQGEVIGFVDVPGHERLVHTMLAGATGIDFVLLVVAADDGVMPQTREHLAILDLLGLKRGLIVLSKADLADAARRAEAIAGIRALTAGTGLADADVIAVSAVTGEGLDTLKSGLDRALAETEARAADGRFRLGVDRVFALAGAGTVVTGTVISGTVRVGDQVMVSPRGITARVRSIHAQSRTAVEGRAGQRCALALVGPDISTDAVARGSVVLDPSLHRPTDRIDAELAVLASEVRPLRQWLPVRVHHAAAEVSARLVPLRDPSFERKGIGPGERDYVQLVLDAPLAAAVGDRFVLRDWAATRTIGGGRFIDLNPPERRRRTAERRKLLDLMAVAETTAALDGLLGSVAGHVELAAFFRDRALSLAAQDAAVAGRQLVVFSTGNVSWALLPETFQRYRDALLHLLDAFHKEKPGEVGQAQETLRLALAPRLPTALFANVLQRLQKDGAIAIERGLVRRAGHKPKLSEEERIWAQLRPLLAGRERFRPPRVRELADSERMGEEPVRRALKMAARRGDVHEVAPDHFFLAKALNELADTARGLAKAAPDGKFNVIAYRDKVDTGRKVAIHILEFFDRQGLTMRRGDWRLINPHKSELFSTPAANPR